MGAPDWRVSLRVNEEFVLDEKTKSRLELADQLFVQATGFSEIAIRNSLSRLYYASFHVAVVLTGGKGHADVSKKLTDMHGDVGLKLKAMHELRNKMDYTPGFFQSPGVSDLELWYQDQVRDGISLYYRLRDLIGEGETNNER